MNGIDKERQDPSTFVQQLSIRSIKMKHNYLFDSNNKNKKWICLELINNEYEVKRWHKKKLA